MVFWLETSKIFIGAFLALLCQLWLFRIKLWSPYAERLWEKRQSLYENVLVACNQYVKSSFRMRNGSEASWSDDDESNWRELHENVARLRLQAEVIASQSFVKEFDNVFRESTQLANDVDDPYNRTTMTAQVKECWAIFDRMRDVARADLKVSPIEAHFDRGMGL